MTIHPSFPRYEKFAPLVPVWCVTPGEGRCLHRFFDTSPFSPSGRYLVAFRMPFEQQLPQPGESGEIVVVDLETGEERVVDETCGWDTQLGANQQWCGSDEHLIYNDVDTTTWKPIGVRLNWRTGERRVLEGGVYQVSPDGKYAVHAALEKMQRTAPGYGVVVPPDRVAKNRGLPDDDGLFLTDTESGKSTLLISIREAFERVAPLLDIDDYAKNGDCYCFHCKWSPDGTRILFSLRWMPLAYADNFGPTLGNRERNRGRWRAMRFNVFTMKPDGSELHCSMPAERWSTSGHHINFFPSGRELSANIPDGNGRTDLMRTNLDGSGYVRMSDRIEGSGHPSVHPDGRHVLTDAYPWEGRIAFDDGTTPLRWIDYQEGTERCLVRMHTKTEQESDLRCDPHPAWDRQWQRFAFNGYDGGTRRVYVADMSALLD